MGKQNNIKDDAMLRQQAEELSREYDYPFEKVYEMLKKHQSENGK